MWKCPNCKSIQNNNNNICTKCNYKRIKARKKGVLGFLASNIIILFLMLITISVVGVYFAYPYIIPFLIKTGELEVITEPSGAAIYIDGDYKEQTPFSDKKLTVGSHSIKIQKDGYITMNLEVDINDEIPVKQVISLNPSSIPAQFSDKKGYLEIITEPEGASIYIGDNYIASSPGITDGLDEGSYKVSVEKYGYEPVVLNVEITAGETIKKEIELVQNPPTKKKPTWIDIMNKVKNASSSKS